MKYKKMRDYTHEEFVQLVLSLDEKQLLDLSANYGGYPVLFRMALDDRISHIPFIQTTDWAPNIQPEERHYTFLSPI